MCNSKNRFWFSGAELLYIRICRLSVFLSFDPHPFLSYFLTIAQLPAQYSIIENIFLELVDGVENRRAEYAEYLQQLHSINEER